MPAGVHLVGSAAYQRHLRATRWRLGLCRLCSQPAAPNRKTCQHHLDYLSRWAFARKLRERRVAA